MNDSRAVHPCRVTNSAEPYSIDCTTRRSAWEWSPTTTIDNIVGILTLMDLQRIHGLVFSWPQACVPGLVFWLIKYEAESKALLEKLSNILECCNKAMWAQQGITTTTNKTERFVSDRNFDLMNYPRKPQWSNFATGLSSSQYTSIMAPTCSTTTSGASRDYSCDAWIRIWKDRSNSIMGMTHQCILPRPTHLGSMIVLTEKTG